MYKFDSREQLADFIHNEILTSSEALQILDCSRQYLTKLVEKGTLTPIKELPRDRWFFKSDILQQQKKMTKKQ